MTTTFPPAQSGLHRPMTTMLRAVLAVLALCAGLTAAAAAAADGDGDLVGIETARSQAEAGKAILIDIREPAEQASGVAPGARLIPMSQLGRRLGEIPVDAAQPVFLICNSQNRSKAVLRALRERGGYAHVRAVEGGMSDWVRRGWPVVKPGA